MPFEYYHPHSLKRSVSWRKKISGTKKIKVYTNFTRLSFVLGSQKKEGNKRKNDNEMYTLLRKKKQILC